MHRLPVGCQITVTGVDGKVETISGHTCKRGIPFATDEFLLPSGSSPVPCASQARTNHSFR